MPLFSHFFIILCFINFHIFRPPIATFKSNNLPYKVKQKERSSYLSMPVSFCIYLPSASSRIRLLSVSFCICPLSVSACPSYTIPKRTRPCGGAVAPRSASFFLLKHLFLLLKEQMHPVDFYKRSAMIRTILYKNPFPLMRIFIRSPFFQHPDCRSCAPLFLHRYEQL